MPAVRVFVLLLLLLPLINACSGPAVEDYAANTPVFTPERFFNGPLTAHGILKDRGGSVTRRFTASLTGTWENGRGLLAEKFEFDDGEIQYRNWQLTPVQTPGSGRQYVGRAEDVVGEARLTSGGNSAFMQYVLEVPYKGRTIQVNVKDRMYLIDEQTLIGESDLSKWGFDVGEIVLTIVKHE
ncbi:DUF3833 domain-containing protein [Microbulbifer bruguierae]|uniref:DUF3833 domain-containing protein n=1 Tax=Microbulbifer bruguierae TaxID=3029061 RepID=A0ABY8N9J1_9GAMM|nr:DUF3833 domain-containing protein [Microbulbifer bruguierae]WGL15571.1 DUF3833 domain-containing protein [Microbulbifer bruguierae]